VHRNKTQLRIKATQVTNCALSKRGNDHDYNGYSKFSSIHNLITTPNLQFEETGIKYTKKLNLISETIERQPHLKLTRNHFQLCRKQLKS